MHPLLSSKGRVALYLLAWLPVGALLAYLLCQTGNLTWIEAASLAMPLSLFYAFVCLAPWYLLPLGLSNIPKLVANHAAASVVAGLLWIVLAKVLGLGLGRYFPRLDERFSPQLPLVFGFGVLLYLLA